MKCRERDNSAPRLGHRGSNRPNEELGGTTTLQFKRLRRNSIHFDEGKSYRTNDTSKIIGRPRSVLAKELL
jgi:hypothetical protein